ncbi:SnoaL-like protein [Hasllibacter halocynthiae]|uniref:SnoaL-like protein n=2 Tax=Hasllibacter halocynthiae TaxID=595589 RepID=A0A2T0X7Z5_9RHOB|nr:SnoaL-like protein [Hasllibacter halocynthiae]
MSVTAIAEALISAIRAGRLVDAVADLYDPEAVVVEGHWSDVGAPLRGHVEIRAAYEARAALVKPAEMDVAGPFLSGPQTTDAGRFALQFHGRLVSHDGRFAQDVRSVGVFEVEGGRIVRQEFFLPPATVPVEPSVRWPAMRGVEEAG